MAGIIDPQHAASSRLKQINLELGQLSHEHKSCQLNSGLLGAIGGVILAASSLGLITLLLSNDADWARNPDSPVYAMAVEELQESTWLAVLVAAGFVIGAGVFYKARSQCAKKQRLWKREGDLRNEMRRIRDRLYASDLPHHPAGTAASRHTGRDTPLQPEEARGEYVGIYNPQTRPRNAKGNPAEDAV
jgi:uncharacterized membrane protein YciS (DUF1049 family)